VGRRTGAGLPPVLDNDAEAAGIVGHDAINTGSNQSTEVAAVVNRPDNKAHACLPGARGVDRIASPEFRHEKILPRLDKQHLENLRRNRYAPNVMCETNVLRSQGAQPCAPSKATFPQMRCRP
jgi:hypothetical protein